MHSILLAAALLCATVPSASAQLFPPRCEIAQVYCPSLQRCLPQWEYCPYPPSAALVSEVSCPQHTQYCNKTDECLPQWSQACVTPTATGVAAASSIVREPPAPVCPHLRFWCPQSRSCLPAWACCTCSEDETHPKCPFDRYWCPLSKSCIGYWIGCGPDGEQIKSETDAIRDACPAGKRLCTKGNRCLPEAASCTAPTADTGCRFGSSCNGVCFPPWGCCNCHESLVAQCATGTFFCKAKNQCLGFEDECK